MPRFLFVDFPLGNPCGKPWDRDMQHAITGGALDFLERAWAPRTMVQRAEIWDADHDFLWRDRFMRVDNDNREALARAGEQRRAEKARKKQATG